MSYDGIRKTKYSSSQIENVVPRFSRYLYAECHINWCDVVGKCKEVIDEVRIMVKTKKVFEVIEHKFPFKDPKWVVYNLKIKQSNTRH